MFWWCVSLLRLEFRYPGEDQAYVADAIFDGVNAGVEIPKSFFRPGEGGQPLLISEPVATTL
jgi:hypothetical protein